MVEASKFHSFLLKMKGRLEPNDAYLVNSPLAETEMVRVFTSEP
jgi:hypothetical protein